MQINKVQCGVLNNNQVSLRQQANTVVVSRPVTKENSDNKKNKNLYTGLAIGGALLLAFVFRKQIKNLFSKNKSSGKKPAEPKPTPKPKEPISQEVERAKIKAENIIPQNILFHTEFLLFSFSLRIFAPEPNKYFKIVAAPVAPPITKFNGSRKKLNDTATNKFPSVT